MYIFFNNRKIIKLKNNIYSMTPRNLTGYERILFRLRED